MLCGGNWHQTNSRFMNQGRNYTGTVGSVYFYVRKNFIYVTQHSAYMPVFFLFRQLKQSSHFGRVDFLLCDVWEECLMLSLSNKDCL